MRAPVIDGFTPWPDDLAARYRREGYWRGELLGDLLAPSVRRDPARTALVCGDRRIAYGELDEWSDRLARGLRQLGVGRHDRVVVQLPNVPELVALCIGLFRLGALPVLALPAHRRAEIAYLCEHAEAVAYVVPGASERFDYCALAREVRAGTPSLRDVLVAGESDDLTTLAEVARGGEGDDEPLAPPAPDEPAFFLLSGGTTALPKLIPRTHDDYSFQLRATAAEMRFGADGVYLAALPAAHNAALGCPGVLGALRAGGRAVLAASPSPDEVFPLIAREGVTLTTLMPAFLSLWIDTAGLWDVDLSGLTIEVGGAVLAKELARQVRPRLGCTLTRWFGMAEGLLSFTRLDEREEVRVTTEGTPLADADELRVVDESDREVQRGEVGELLVHGPYTLRGYYKADDYNARVFTPDGFFRTGDLVRITPAGYLTVEGRIKDVVNRAGEKVPAEELETHLLAHPRVKEAAVLAVPDRTLGERTCAVIVAAGAPPPLAELRAFVTERGLAEYKLPDRLEVVGAFPRTSLGKINKNELRSELGLPGYAGAGAAAATSASGASGATATEVATAT